MILNKKLSNLIAITLVVFLLFGCNVAKTDEEGNEISDFRIPKHPLRTHWSISHSIQANSEICI